MIDTRVVYGNTGSLGGPATVLSGFRPPSGARLLSSTLNYEKSPLLMIGLLHIIGT